MSSIASTEDEGQGLSHSVAPRQRLAQVLGGIADARTPLARALSFAAVRLAFAGETAARLPKDADCDPLEGFENVKAVLRARLPGRSVGDAAGVLRRAGFPQLAAQLKGLSRLRNVRAHPPVQGLAAEIDQALLYLAAAGEEARLEPDPSDAAPAEGFPESESVAGAASVGTQTDCSGDLAPLDRRQFVGWLLSKLAEDEELPYVFAAAYEGSEVDLRLLKQVHSSGIESEGKEGVALAPVLSPEVDVHCAGAAPAPAPPPQRADRGVVTAALELAAGGLHKPPAAEDGAPLVVDSLPEAAEHGPGAALDPAPPPRQAGLGVGAEVSVPAAGGSLQPAVCSRPSASAASSGDPHRERRRRRGRAGASLAAAPLVNKLVALDCLDATALDPDESLASVRSGPPDGFAAVGRKGGKKQGRAPAQVLPSSEPSPAALSAGRGRKAPAAPVAVEHRTAWSAFAEVEEVTPLASGDSGLPADDLDLVDAVVAQPGRFKPDLVAQCRDVQRVVLRSVRELAALRGAVVPQGLGLRRALEHLA